MLARSFQPFGTFDPKSIPGITLWFDADDANSFSYSSGTTISQWNDKSGNANHMVVYSGQTAPARTVDSGRNAVVFAEGNALRTNNNISYAALTSTVFVVVRRISVNSAASIGMLLSMADDNFSNVGDYSIRYSTNNLINGDTNDIGLGRYHVNGIFPSSTTASIYSSYHIISTAVNLTRTGNSRVSLSHPFASRFFIGAVSEVLIFSNNEFTLQNRQTVEGYLAWKWNLPSVLSFAHPSRSVPLLTRTFTPLDIDKCALWLDAADRSTINFGSGVNVTSWLDKSPNSLTATSFVLGNRTITYTNTAGYNGVYFDNGSSVFNTAGQYAFLSLSANIQDQADYTIFAVVNFANIQSGILQTIYSNFRGTVAESRAPQFGVGDSFEANTNNTAFRFGNGASQFSPAVRCLVSLRSSSVNLIYSGNGTSITTANSSLVRFTSDIGNTPTIGGTYNLSTNSYVDNRWTTGAFHEMIFYNQALSDSDRNRVEGYLTQKWELQSLLPTAQPFYLFRSIPTTSLFVPTSLPNCALWLDGMDRGNMSFSGATNTITVWNDKSGNGRNAAAVGTPTLDPKGGVIFNGSSCFQNTATAINLSQRSIYFVFRQTVYTRFDGIISIIPNPSSGFDYEVASGLSIALDNLSGGAITIWGNNSSIVNLGLLSDANNDQIYNDNVAGTIATFRYNGGPLLTRNLSYTPTTGSGYVIGGRWMASLLSNARHNGVISEVIIYSTVLSRGQSQQVEGYLAAKWGLIGRIPARHSFRAIFPGYGLPADSVVTNTKVNFLFTRFYGISDPNPSSAGPGNFGWTGEVGTAGRYNPIDFQDGDGRASLSDYVGHVSQGFVYSASATTIDFYIVVDDGGWVEFNGTPVITNGWKLQADTAYQSGVLTLPAGYTPITYRFYEWGGGMTSYLYYRIPGGSGNWIADGTGVFFSDL